MSGLIGGQSSLPAQAPVADSAAIEAKVHSLIGRLTLAQEIELLGGSDGMYTTAAPEIGLGPLKMSDGPLGVRSWGPTTAYPAGAALAATWDRELARQMGAALGKDARARGVHFLLGPGVNIARSPLAGRNFEYLSEDPFLTAELAVPYIEGVQSQGVIATVKHLALNNQEYNRHGTSSDADERTMREIYLPAFEAAVTRAHVDAVMDSYNLVNGVHATESEFLNLEVLKREWGFQGLLMSDWAATYNSIGAANHGLDLEMPSAAFMNTKALTKAVQEGTVKKAVIDDKVLRLLRLVLRYGFLNRPQSDPQELIYSAANRAVALRGALESVTLLKNDRRLLPLNLAKIKTIAVIGPNAWPAVVGGGGSSEAQAFAPVSLLTGIADLVGAQVRLLYSRGIPELDDSAAHVHWVNGVEQSIYPSADFSGQPAVSQLTQIVDERPESWGPTESQVRSVRYRAAFTAKVTGSYLVVARVAGNDQLMLRIDGQLYPVPYHVESLAPQSWKINLTAGQTVQLVADYRPAFASPHFSLGIFAESDLVAAEVKAYASSADAVVVAVGFNSAIEHEGFDRTFDLPWGQAALINAVVEANPRTIVVLNGGGGMNTQGWLAQVPALIHAYYPGQEGGTALAKLIFGQANPEGKLPVSFDRSWAENPSSAFYYPKPGSTEGATVPHVSYDDRLMVGYRYWSTQGKHPLFPFGFGLSYTTFEFSKLEVPAAAAAGTPVVVGFDLTNTGRVAGAEVPQLYVSDPTATIIRPERELKGFAKVMLRPGETRHLTFQLDARAFSYWSETAHRWTIDPGKFIIRVGDSSESTPLSAPIILQ